MKCKDIDYLPMCDFSVDLLASCATVSRRKKGVKYLNMISAFDIETSVIPIGDNDHSILYMCQLCFLDPVTGAYHCFLGRDWDDVRHFADECQRLPSSVRLVVFVHNLSYEFQFLRTIYDFKPHDVWCLDSRKILRAIMGKIEFRCSYIHSNMSLDLFTSKMDAPHRKQSGDDFDYKAVRYPWTTLTDDQVYYGLCDVLGLCEALQREMQIDGDDISTIPLTSTGYVRRDMRRAMKNAFDHWIGSLLPDVTVYTLLREAFRGGNTHANRYFAGRIVGPLYSFDRQSSYPAVQCTRRFPMSPFKPYPNCSYDDLIRLIGKRNRAILARIAMSNISLRDQYWPVPYISKSMCRNLQGGVYDNGRVLSAEYLECTVTDVDLEIIADEYNGQMCIIDCYTASYGYMPPEYVNQVVRYFDFKTTLKGVQGQEIFYMKSKNKLNSIYGMSAQDPGKMEIRFVDGQYQTADDSLDDVLAEFNRTAFMPYSWGVWTTAWARYELELGIRLCSDSLVYVDTDSVKCLKMPDLSAYNDNMVTMSQKRGAYAVDRKGKTQYMGVYEQEKTYTRFATLGAKKYAYCYDDGKTHIAIAGVTKAKGGEELDRGDEFGKGLERFIKVDPGFTFYDAGGVEAVYIDSVDTDHIYVDGRRLEIGPCVVLRDSTYTLGLTAEYERLIRGITGSWGYDGKIQ